MSAVETPIVAAGHKPALSVLRTYAENAVRDKVCCAAGALRRALDTKSQSDRVAELRYALGAVAEALEAEARAHALGDAIGGAR